MNYFITREGKEYGPYTLADLQRYVASGNVLLTDLARSEAMTEWVPVGQVIGNIPVPVVQSQPAVAPAVTYPDPPALHWGVVLLLGIVTCGLFGWVWAFVEAAWLKKVNPESKAIYYYVGAVGALALAVILSVNREMAPIGGVVNLGGAVVWLFGAFRMKGDIEEHFNSAEPIGLSLSGVMTFFFNVYYFQYHFTKIGEMKKSGQMHSMAAGLGL